MKDIGVQIRQQSGAKVKLLNHTNLRCICNQKCEHIDHLIDICRNNFVQYQTPFVLHI